MGRPDHGAAYSSWKGWIMDLRALRTFRFGSDNIRRGMPVTMSDARAKEHLSRGLVEEVKAEKAEPAKRGDKPAATAR